MVVVVEDEVVEADAASKGVAWCSEGLGELARADSFITSPDKDDMIVGDEAGGEPSVDSFATPAASKLSLRREDDMREVDKDVDVEVEVEVEIEMEVEVEVDADADDEHRGGDDDRGA